MNRSEQVHRITRLAILVAIIFLLAFTPLGYLTIGPISATTIQMPVIVGAVLMGPQAGTDPGIFLWPERHCKGPDHGRVRHHAMGINPFGTSSSAWGPGSSWV